MAEVTPPVFEVESVAGYTAEISQAHGGKGYAGGQPLSPSSIESWIIHYTNAEREAAGLRSLTHDPAISTIAREHSRDMAKFGLYHEIHGKNPTDRALEAGYDCRAYRGDGSYSFGLSENIYKYPKISEWSGRLMEIVPISFHSDQTMASALVKGWMNSPGHRRNILDISARRIGVGVVIREDRIARSAGLHQETVFATQNFSGCQ
ncbi:CAP domain-containing protein [Candidatus Synechococcus spongiarum]|nr:CAP domain-containing protein [Candidatus Synechococcus spongiarum]